MNKNKGEIVGGTIGRVIEIDTGDHGIGWGLFLRVLIEIDIHKPLARGRTINLMVRTYWIPLRYETLPHFCFNCSCTMHDELGCKGEKDGEAQFGVWLKARGRPKFKEGWRNSERINKVSLEGDCSGDRREEIEKRGR